MSAPWLTPADRAEWDVLWRALVDEVFDHRERGCARCDDGDCPAVRGAIEAAVEWAERRSLRSFALAMRARQDSLDADVPSLEHPPTRASRRVFRLGQAGQRRTPT